MNNNNACKKAKEFLKEYRLKCVTLPDLWRIITSQGYTIVPFNHIFNDESTAKLIEALGLEDAIAHSRGFTYADRQRRLVFIHEDLSEKEKLLVLAHEEGHIYCGHFTNSPIIGHDVTEEQEAAEFTHFILKKSGAPKSGGASGKRKLPLMIILSVLAAALIGTGIFFATRRDEPEPFGHEYYLTSTGFKYHESECIFVKNKDDARLMTKEEYESGIYSPCGVCLPPVTSDSTRS